MYALTFGREAAKVQGFFIQQNKEYRRFRHIDARYSIVTQY